MTGSHRVTLNNGGTMRYVLTTVLVIAILTVCDGARPTEAAPQVQERSVSYADSEAYRLARGRIRIAGDTIISTSQGAIVEPFVAEVIRTADKAFGYVQR